MTTTATATAPTPSNAEVARRIGRTHSYVSRLRSGDRLPSWETGRLIEREYGWDLGDQALAREANDWAAQFEKVLQRDIDQTPAG